MAKNETIQVYAPEGMDDLIWMMISTSETESLSSSSVVWPADLHSNLLTAQGLIHDEFTRLLKIVERCEHLEARVDVLKLRVRR